MIDSLPEGHSRRTRPKKTPNHQLLVHLSLRRPRRPQVILSLTAPTFRMPLECYARVKEASARTQKKRELAGLGVFDYWNVDCELVLGFWIVDYGYAHSSVSRWRHRTTIGYHSDGQTPTRLHNHVDRFICWS